MLTKDGAGGLSHEMTMDDRNEGKRRRRGRGGGSGNTPIWVTSYVHIYEQLLRPIPPLWWQLRHYWDKYIFKFREIHHEILTNIFYKFYKYWSKSWKLHQFHPDGDSWDIIGNILGHLLNLSPTVSRYMTQGKTSGSKSNSNHENMTTEVFCIFVHVYACVIGLYTCQANYVIFAVYPVLHISSTHREPTNVIFHHIHNISFPLGVGPKSMQIWPLTYEMTKLLKLLTN